jgi:hypothetical protein
MLPPMWGTAKRSRIICGLSQGEFLVCALVIGVVIWLTAQSAAVAIAHVRQAEILLLATSAKTYWVERWANDGRIQSAKPFVKDRIDGSFSVALQSDIGDGSFTYRMTTRPLDAIGATITFRPAIATDPEVTSLVWVCGNRPAPRGFVAAGENLTQLSDPQLISACRAPL